jgi:hypothetical protein
MVHSKLQWGSCFKGKLQWVLCIFFFCFIVILVQPLPVSHFSCLTPGNTDLSATM